MRRCPRGARGVAAGPARGRVGVRARARARARVRARVIGWSGDRVRAGARPCLQLLQLLQASAELSHGRQP